MASCGTFQKLSPLSLLAHLSSCYDSALLKVTSSAVTWSVYLEEGKITYASHSIAAFDRLDCHLHRLSYKVPTLTSETRAQLSLIFETEAEQRSDTNPEYQAIGWLVNHQYLNAEQAAELVAELVGETIESFLLVKSGQYDFSSNSNLEQIFCRLELQPIVDLCQKRLQKWQALAPEIFSPYQRLYFSNRHKLEQQIPSEIQQKFSTILKGFSFRHLAILLNQDELELAQNLHQYIAAGTILLQDPYAPFDQLPRTFEQTASPSTTPIVIPEKVPLPLDDIRDRHISDRRLAATPKAFEREPVRETQFPTTKQESLPIQSPQPHSEPVKHSSQPPVNFPITRTTPPVPPTHIETPTSPPTVIPDAPATRNKYKIVCVDDSPAMLQELKKFLEDDLFSVFTIDNPVKALMQIIKVKPNLILLDVNMAGIDGYELCRLLRNHSLFKDTPIIMVTANTGIINRVKARVVGASGYLTKPFSQPDILKMVFRHLT
ncbi:response regulator [Chroococcidiopsis sp. FACHB-1243]|uniref:response regulator n=1 Tax=Chroococcidiopsis sp. [FACHB-1243] TaxID=2692781 RepID=UPI001780C60F|nr:response regulator [Chroococcidiopsis sp. [FACHB-1243]]MBD2304702.1 response regulator [Chroococcidiopsis sp. [FACHB-1243]]